MSCHNDKCCSKHEESCGCEKSRHRQCDRAENQCDSAHHFLDVADCAWMEVLKDKIKEHILATENDRMKELAKIIAEANKDRWRNKKQKHKHCKEFEEKLCHFFAHAKK